METYPSQIAHGLMFHRFHKSGNPYAGQGSVTEVEFEKILNYVGTERIQTPEEWIARVKTYSLHKHHLCITFDDGLKSQFDVALPVLEKYKLKAFWFVFSSVFNGGIDRNEAYNHFAITEFSSFDVFVENFLQFFPAHNEIFRSNNYKHFTQRLKKMFPFYTENDLKYRYIRNKMLIRSDFEKIMDRLIESKGLSVSKITEDLWLTNAHLQSLHRNGHCIGLHSYDHPFNMAHLNINKQRNQYLLNYQHITHVIGDTVECMSHPLNSYSADTIKILSNMGIVCGFCSSMSRKNVKKTIYEHSLELPREDAANLIKRITV